jgi:hypothetical protein
VNKKKKKSCHLHTFSINLVKMHILSIKNTYLINLNVPILSLLNPRVRPVELKVFDRSNCTFSNNLTQHFSINWNVVHTNVHIRSIEIHKFDKSKSTFSTNRTPPIRSVEVRIFRTCLSTAYDNRGEDNFSDPIKFRDFGSRVQCRRHIRKQEIIWNSKKTEIQAMRNISKKLDSGCRKCDDPSCIYIHL